jgi:membrane protease YdiL (CAAX protease family)
MKSLRKALPKILVLSVIIFIVIQLLNVVLGGQFQFDFDHVKAFGYTILYTLSLSYANWALFQFLDKVFESNRFATKRIIIGFVGSFVVTLIVIFLLRIFEEVLVNGQSFQNYIAHERSANYVVSVIITFIISLSFYAFYLSLIHI